MSALRGYWNRKRKGGNRQVDQIPVLVVARTVGGSLVVEYERRGRNVRQLVTAADVQVYVDQPGVAS